MSQLKKFGTFSGVFTPAILTILGVIMYLRLGWVVGSVGLSRAIGIIILAHIVTLTTGLSLASLATNVRVGAGGFYAFISRSLGAEAGGAIGIPLFISQALSISFYIMGFSEAWALLFPLHNHSVILVTVSILLVFLSYVGANFAIKAQFVIMALILLSIISFIASPDYLNTETEFFTRGASDLDFWYVFAVFFPAVTGIGAGVAMSGELKDPKKNLPLGVLAAIAVGFVIYFVLALLYARIAPSEELVNNSFVMIERSRVPMLVILGLMGATLSSALGSLVGAPRILQALASDRVVPLSSLFARKSKNGTPRSAIVLTGIIVLVTLFAGDLDSVAALLTMFFLISYAVINFTVFIEKLIRIPSFRPSFRIPLIIPAVGMIWCTVVMFLINMWFAISAYVVIGALYFWYVRRGLNAPFGDVRSGIFTAIAEWAVKTSSRLPQHEKSWKPNLIVPIQNDEQWSMRKDFVKAIVNPGGTLRLVSVNETDIHTDSVISSVVNRYLKSSKYHKQQYLKHFPGYEKLSGHLAKIKTDMQNEGGFITTTVVDAISFLEGLSIVIQASKGMFFPPNSIFLSMSNDKKKDRRLMEILAISVREKLGIILLNCRNDCAFGDKKRVNIWLRIDSPNKNLAILTALQLTKNWRCSLQLLTSITSAHEHQHALSALKEIKELGRLNTDTELFVINKPFTEALATAPAADLNIFGISLQVDIDYIRVMSNSVSGSSLFIMDSGNERIDV
ncbi:MAG: amino acid permease [Spirochaetes bacterium]|jgi:solute carrier family 12 sodium/potassium/chloride transporter 2|nr:amino acid permease [Spirochaetota bacterium]